MPLLKLFWLSKAWYPPYKFHGRFARCKRQHHSRYITVEKIKRQVQKYHLIRVTVFMSIDASNRFMTLFQIIYEFSVLNSNMCSHR